ncbi:DUF2158 domain-containing protein [Pinisolibacter aquiterrae]|uniref:DUF2158 domain-containing protein n=1 Tax=Pinisolibacter aquiterrae TaxID=2815579 RepID=UPI001C3E0E83|nr:DUF2158 domain-containing protein [Pinisolibacter aquiterrae]MBV5263392.1 DUF2158 domain-containing protein [Pinisolibacter aquiterrae]MCC8237530.1 DUF2158 domain-containing protein [Pinisolibacter aquiterrae]
MSETETPVTTLSAGDVVVLKSGGPMLTVASILGDLASCVWFCEEEQAYRFEDLPAAVLIAVAFEDDEDEDAG